MRYTDNTILSRFSAFFPLYLLDIDRIRWDNWQLEISFSSTHMLPGIWWLSISSLAEVQTYWPKFNLSRENIEISAFCKFIKILNLNEFEKWGRHVICPRDRLDMLYSTGEFDWPTYSTVWVMVKKPILRSNSLNFFVPIGFREMSIFLKSLY